MKRYLLVKIITVIFLLTGCKGISEKIRIEGPHHDFKERLESASPEFRKGWYDGCETGRSGGDDTFYKAFTRNNVVDGYMMFDSYDYKVAWNAGWWYCYRDDFIDQKSTPFASFFRGLT